MSDEAYKAVKDEVSYEGWHFCTGQKSISVRRLEQIRRLYPIVEEVKGRHADSFRPQNNSSLTEVQQVRREPALENCSESGVVISYGCECGYKYREASSACNSCKNH